MILAPNLKHTLFPQIVSILFEITGWEVLNFYVHTRFWKIMRESIQARKSFKKYGMLWKKKVATKK